MATEKNKGGRPSDFSPELADEICSLLMVGESLRSICKRQGMPVLSTVTLWLSKHEEFSVQYARAREIQAEVLAEDAMNIADAAVEDSAAVAKARLQVDARKWYASKVAPKKYGDRIQHEQRITLADRTDEEIDKRIQELINGQVASPERDDSGTED
ncbi:DNA packaging protein [Symbiopectobacterium purcellii]|uniref:DNA packaging protein n=1 Tax=Symbiopectobacterium purcellii TaxID=2871826 RepID=A0ABX9AG42_9ENTR|nr:DNA packaging protein [Symbiopectobacterium purcellii]QZN94120.1 DNA packaging protein [Symbiopectobacterium purcellii]